jgi:hypothetical protein
VLVAIVCACVAQNAFADPVHAAILLVSSAAYAQPTTVYRVPADISSDGSTDVTQALLSWVASIPDESVLLFGKHACYRIEGTIELSNRTGFEFRGNGSTFRSTSPSSDQRAMWRVIDSRRSQSTT